MRFTKTIDPRHSSRKFGSAARLRRSRHATLGFLLAALLLAASCADGGAADRGQAGGPGGAADVDGTQLPGGSWFRPTVGTTWQWQLQPDARGDINTGYDVMVYDIDLFDAPDAVIQELRDAGRKVLCYFSAGSVESFREDAGQFREEDVGNVMEGFPDERWVDIRSADVRRIMLARLDLASARGCDGVEPDNATGSLNDTGFDLSWEDQLAYNRFLANAAHERNLFVALKNDLEQVPELVDYFDLALNEECHEFGECQALTAFIAAGKPVFNAEYAEEFVNDPAAREALCAEARAQDFRTLVLPADLDDSFRLSCDP